MKLNDDPGRRDIRGSLTQPPANLLVVEDDEELLLLITNRLARKQYHVDGVTSADAALKKFSERTYDLMLLDLRLPGMSSAELLTALEQRRKDCAFIITTGQGDERVAVEMMKRGAREYLIKDQNFFQRLDHEVGTALAELETEHKLREAQRQLKHLADFPRMNPHPVLEVDQRGGFIYLNPAIRQLVVELKLTRVEDLLPPDYCAIVRNCIRANANQLDVPVELRERTLVWSFYPLAEMKTAHIYGRDVSEKLQLEQQLLQAQKMEEIGRLAAGVAHEINTPMQYIGDNVTFIREAFEAILKIQADYRNLLNAAGGGRLDPQALAELERRAGEYDFEYYLAEIPAAIAQSLEGIDHVQKIVRSMKEFSHPGEDQKRAVDVNRALESALNITRNEWKYTAEVETRLDPLLPQVTCYPGQLNQVLLNLIVNAAHAITEAREALPSESPAPKGRITITTANTGDHIEIRITDTGTGIPEEIRERVFDPFFTTKKIGKGTGQGLTIARAAIVDTLGGKLFFETEPDRGTTFVIQLPLESGAAQS